MNLADKTNTQLICLTGLGGESIYNRFDNIYVLNLIEAHLRNGIQYLRPEHKKGEEVKVETILPTHIEVEEMLFYFAGRRPPKEPIAYICDSIPAG